MLVNAASVSPSQASIETILHVDMYGTSVLLEEIGKVIKTGGTIIVYYGVISNNICADVVAATHPEAPALQHVSMACCYFVIAIGLAYASMKLYDLLIRAWLAKKILSKNQ